MGSIECVSKEINKFNEFCSQNEGLDINHNVIQPAIWKNYLLSLFEKYYIDKNNVDEGVYLKNFKMYINNLVEMKFKEICLEYLEMLTEVYFNDSTSNINFIYYIEDIKNIIKNIFTILSIDEIKNYTDRLYLIDIKIENYFMISKMLNFICILFFNDIFVADLFNNLNFRNFINSLFEKLQYFNITEPFVGYKKYILSLIYQLFKLIPVKYYLYNENLNNNIYFMEFIKNMINISFKEGLLYFNNEDIETYDFDFYLKINFLNYFNYLLRNLNNNFCEEFKKILVETNNKIIDNVVNLLWEKNFLHKKYYDLFDLFDKIIEFTYSSNINNDELIDNLINIYNKKFIKSVDDYFHQDNFTTKYLKDVFNKNRFIDVDNSDTIKIDIFYFNFFFKLLNHPFFHDLINIKLSKNIEENYESKEFENFVKNISLMTKLNYLDKKSKKLSIIFNDNLLKFFDEIFDNKDLDYFGFTEYLITPITIFYININYKNSNFLKYMFNLFYKCLMNYVNFDYINDGGIQYNNIMDLMFIYLYEFDSRDNKMLIHNYLKRENIYLKLFKYGKKSIQLNRILSFLDNTIFDYFILIYKDYKNNKMINNYYSELVKFIFNVLNYTASNINHEFHLIIRIIHSFLIKDNKIKTHFLEYFNWNKFYILLIVIIQKEHSALKYYIGNIINLTIDYIQGDNFYYFIKFIYYYQQYFVLDYNNFNKIISNYRLNNIIDSNKCLYGFCYLIFIFIRQSNSCEYNENSNIIYCNYLWFLYYNYPANIYNLSSIKYITDYNMNITIGLNSVITFLLYNLSTLNFLFKIYLVRFYYKFINFNIDSWTLKDDLVNKNIIKNILNVLYSLECEIFNFFNNNHNNKNNNDIVFIINKIAVDDKHLIIQIFNDYKSIYYKLLAKNIKIDDFINNMEDMGNIFKLQYNMLRKKNALIMLKKSLLLNKIITFI